MLQGAQVFSQKVRALVLGQAIKALLHCRENMARRSLSEKPCRYLQIRTHDFAVIGMQSINRKITAESNTIRAENINRMQHVVSYIIQAATS